MEITLVNICCPCYPFCKSHDLTLIFQLLSSGVNLATAFLNSIARFGLNMSHVKCITTDNASNNTTCMDALSDIATAANVEWEPEDYHIRCIAHVMNLAVQAALASLRIQPLEASEVADGDADQVPASEMRSSKVIQRLRKVIVKV